jgi:hypothetical protein
VDKPHIFVSSTFYDLRQIRSDLRDFIENDLGYIPLISEMSSFPIDPDTNTIENSKQRVQDSADLMILIIGGRYGTVAEDEEKSITNLEYSVARLKGIPIYAFVEKKILATLSIWNANPEADFSSVVDTVLLFEFVTEVRSQDRVWTFPFETAQDIIRVLRNQFAYLMSRGLELQIKLRGDPEEYRGLSGEALRIAVDRLPGWQGKLFAYLVSEAIQKSRDLKRAYDLGIYFGVGERVDEVQAFRWLAAKAEEAERLSSGIAPLVNTSLKEAFASLDIQQIAYTAREVGRAYQEALRWSLDLRKAHIDDEFHILRDEVSLMTGDIINQIEKLSPRIVHAIDEAIEKAADEDIKVYIEFVISAVITDEYKREFARLSAKYGA